MKRECLIATGFILALMMVFSVGCAQSTLGGILESQQEGIWVTGTGKVLIAPDVADVSLGIEAQEASVARAQTKAAEVMSQIMDALTDHGLAQKDIQTQQFSIQQVTRWDDDKKQEIVIGYRVSNIVIVKIRILDKVGTIIDSVAEAGGDLTRVNSIYFSIEDPSAHYAELREMAMEQAETTAKQLATLGGVTLGKPTYISESIFTPFPDIRASAEAVPTTPTPISPGEIEMSLNVQVIYSIVE